MGISARDVAALARSGYLKGRPYTQYDCQGYIKALLRKFGIVKKWLGTNDMWRNHVHGHTPINSPDAIPVGAMLFNYNPNRLPPYRYPAASGDCNHVGIYIGGGEYWHSTSGGVQHGVNMSRWTHWAYLDCLEYARPTTWKSEVLDLEANRIKYTWKDPDGTEHYEILELTETVNIMSVEAYKKD